MVQKTARGGFDQDVPALAPNGQPLAISAGLAMYPGDGGSFDALLAAADARMYQDKASRALKTSS